MTEPNVLLTPDKRQYKIIHYLFTESFYEQVDNFFAELEATAGYDKNDKKQPA